ncbi:unnamed protein product (macronuclear) [Paramecium tetraurelia]|uniref:Uncharacterized protein n=1 Tax=Paramecium tetraurelia TaxID=5888 RepID=A0DBW7_PARTE|nr:uncharacterized protein GSPATT00015411001 [Paramecium tetraurelia]CAK80534.1 unnamed protein product [Paramecium tetraurelia]|eukprot:XP_001447931.1 hypothetical protein (macronuclear) [Paramecium tetraurelia strain d4-2]
MNSFFRTLLKRRLLGNILREFVFLQQKYIEKWEKTESYLNVLKSYLLVIKSVGPYMNGQGEFESSKKKLWDLPMRKQLFEIIKIM